MIPGYAHSSLLRLSRLACQSSDDEMKKKNNMISRLEEKTNQITATMKQLEQR